MNLTLSTKVKEAIKVSLAMVLVYGIALKVNWMNPSWAGLAVAMIALATAGQSIRKGLLRIAGWRLGNERGENSRRTSA